MRLVKVVETKAAAPPKDEEDSHRYINKQAIQRHWGPIGEKRMPKARGSDEEVVVLMRGALW